MTYQTALQYLSSFFNLESVSQFSYHSDLNITRVRILLNWFAHPEKRFRSILVAGTKGKGSTAYFLSSILQAHRLKVGLYTSPHLVDFRERIRVDAQMISKADFARLVSQMKCTIEKRRKEIRGLEPITFFEISTVLAFLYFAEREIDWAVLEVGMGGRLDATNTVKQSLSVFTLIGKDHEEYLGKTVRLIAGEKAAVMKRGVPFVSAKQSRGALQVIQSKAGQLGAPGYVCGHQFRFQIREESLSGSQFDFEMKGVRLLNTTIKLPGTFQVRNAALAIAAATVLKERRYVSIQDRFIRKGLLESDWPGRFELIGRRGRTFILDGAHNEDSVRALAQSVRKLFPHRKIIVIFGVSREKKLKPILRILGGLCSTMILTKAGHPRAQLPKIMIEDGTFPGFTIPTVDIREAISNFEKIADRADIALITGSLFLVGEARKVLKS